MSDSIGDRIEALFITSLPGKDIVGLIKTSWDWFPTQLGMLATCRQYVGNVSKCRQFLVDMRVGADTKMTPTQEFCVGNHRQIVDTVVRTDT